MTAAEIETVNKMVEEHKELANLYCTGCDYCMPCPANINIPHIFGIMNQHRAYGLTEAAKKNYNDVIQGWTWEKSADASKCTECGECEKKCPQKLPIMAQLRETHETLKP
jgi:hypothetical protein